MTTAEDPALRDRFKPTTRGGHRVLSVRRRSGDYAGSFPLLATLRADGKPLEEAYTEQGRWGLGFTDPLDLLPADPEPAAEPAAKPAAFGGEAADDWRARWQPTTRDGREVLAVWEPGIAVNVVGDTLMAVVKDPPGSCYFRSYPADGRIIRGRESPGDLLPVAPPPDPARELAALPPGSAVRVRSTGRVYVWRPHDGVLAWHGHPGASLFLPLFVLDPTRTLADQADILAPAEPPR